MDKFSLLLEKLKSKKALAVSVAVGLTVTVLIVYFACFTGGNSTASSGINEGEGDYCSVMRTQVESIVSKIDGVGNAAVVINWDKSPSKGYFGSGEEQNPKPVGALIVCDGGNSTKVKLDVIYAVSTLLDLSIDKIMVYPKSI